MQVHLQRSQTAGAEGQEVHGNHLNSASSQDSPLHILGVAELKNFPCGATSSHTPDLQQQGYWNCSSCPRSQVSNSVASSKKPPPGGGGGGGGGGGRPGGSEPLPCPRNGTIQYDSQFKDHHMHVSDIVE